MPTFAAASRNSWAARTSTVVDSIAISRNSSGVPSAVSRTPSPLRAV